MTVRLFIDTNIYLSFYHFSDDDIEELQKVVGLIQNGQLHVYLTSQIIDEFVRNRESKIAETIKQFNEFKVSKAVPRLMLHYPEAKKFLFALKSVQKWHADLVKQSLSDAEQNILPADKLFSEIRKVIKTAEVTEDAWARAERRLKSGNPPGKNKSLGDALNWETLLNEVDRDAELHIISRDSDYSSKLSAGIPNQFLQEEWLRVNGGRLLIYNDLRTFFSKHFPQIKLASDIEKRYAIDQFKSSGSFARTHSNIVKMQTFLPILTNAEMDELIEAALENPQIGWISTDPDVAGFYRQILPLRYESFSEEKRQRLKSLFLMNWETSQTPDEDEPLF